MIAPDPADRTLGETDRRELIIWAMDCAERLLPLFAAHRASDPRLSDAIASGRSFAHGGLGVDAMRARAFACHAAAREADDPSAIAVARLCGQTAAVAHMAGHAREIARYTQKALSGESLDAELAWQAAHLPPRFKRYVLGRED